VVEIAPAGPGDETTRPEIRPREKKYKKPLSISADSIYVIKPAGLNFQRWSLLVCPEPWTTANGYPDNINYE
jgi:hypothetical protein